MDAIRIVLNISGIYGTGRGVMGAFFSDGSFRRKVGDRKDGTCQWAIADLPVRFRTQLDVNSTLDAFGGRKVAGSYAASAVDGYAAVAWKAGREWTLDGLAEAGKLNVAFVEKVRAYYKAA